MILISAGSLDMVTDSTISPGHMSDHSTISVTIKTNNYHRGPGVWKFNNHLLVDEYFCEKIIHEIAHSGDCPGLNDSKIWENIKMNVSKVSREYSKIKARKKRYDKVKLVELKTRLELDSIKNTERMDIVDNIVSINEKLDQLAIEEAEKCIFCSRARYVKEGEKNTAYFFSLEKR